MERKIRRRIILGAIYAGTLAFQVPVAIVAEKFTGGVGGLLLLTSLFGWRFVDTLAPSGIAEHDRWLVVVAAFALYLAIFSTLVLPAHFVLRDRDRIHVVVLCLIALGFCVFAAFAWPVRGVPV